MHPGGELALGVMVVMCREGDLLEVVGAGDAVGRFAYLLHRRHEEADEHRNDGNYHQQFDQGEARHSLGLEGLEHGNFSFWVECFTLRACHGFRRTDLQSVQFSSDGLQIRPTPLGRIANPSYTTWLTCFITFP